MLHGRLDAQRPCFGSSKSHQCIVKGRTRYVVARAASTADEAPKRVVVTGLGVISSLGQDHETFYNNLLAGKSGISPIQHFDASDWTTNFAGEIRNLETEGYLTKKLERRIDDVIKFTIVAGKKALGDAGLKWDGPELNDLDKQRCGIMIGACCNWTSAWLLCVAEVCCIHSLGHHSRKSCADGSAAASWHPRHR